MADHGHQLCRRGQGHIGTARQLQLDVIKIRRVIDRRATGHDIHIRLDLVRKDGDGDLALGHCADGLGDLGLCQAKDACHFGINADLVLRLHRVVGKLRVQKRLILRHRRDQSLGCRGHRRDVLACHRELQALPAAADIEAVGSPRRGLNAWHPRQLAADLGDQCGLAAVTIAPVIEPHDDEGAGATADANDALNRGNLATFLIGGQDLFDLINLGIKVVDRGIRGTARLNQKEPAILVGRDGRGQSTRRPRCHDHKGPRRPQHHQRHANGFVHHRVKHPPGPALRLCRCLKRGFPRIKKGRQNRCQSQRGDGRQRDSKGQHKTELAEHPTGLTGQERDRDKHRRQRRGGRDDGKEHLVRARRSGSKGPHPLFTFAHDILDHDNRVIHHHPRRQHQRQQADGIDREPRQPDRGDRPHQRHRNGHRRDHYRTGGAQKGKDHHNHNPRRQSDGFHHLGQGSPDECPIVRGHEKPNAVGQRRLQISHRNGHIFRDRQRVAHGLPRDVHADGGLPVHAGQYRVLFRQQPHERHVRNARIRINRDLAHGIHGDIRVADPQRQGLRI